MSKEYEPYMFRKRNVDGFVLKWKDSLRWVTGSKTIKKKKKKSKLQEYQATPFV